MIGSRTAPVEEVLRDCKNGLLVDFFAREAIADRVIEALEAPEACAAMREQAREVSRHGSAGGPGWSGTGTWSNRPLDLSW